MTKKYSFWNGPDETDRRIKYAKQFKPEYQANGDDVQRRIDAVLVAFKADTGIVLPEGYSSGWRPPSVNEATANSGKGSAHLEANAGDKRDDANGNFSWWCHRNTGVLEQHGLWMEHPSATVYRAFLNAKAGDRDATPWCHLSRVPPKSGSRIYWPDTKSLMDWETFVSGGGYPGMTYDEWLAITLALEAGEKRSK